MKQILPAMVAEGYEVGFIACAVVKHGILELDGVRYYPKILERYGEDGIVQHGDHFQADVVITLGDIYLMSLDAIKEFAELGINWIGMTPIDHEPVPPSVVERLEHAYEIITYSLSGHRELTRSGLSAHYIPHTVDTRIFRQYDKPACRREFGIPEDIFLFGMVAANNTNPSRKSYQEVLDTFKEFHELHPDSGLYIHAFFEGANGFPIGQYARHLGIREAIYNMDDYRLLYLVDRETMARLYSCFDCLLNPSIHEGFGVPIIEAMACQVPVIANDFTAMRDLVEDGVTGFLTRPLYRRFTFQKSYVGVPCPRSLSEAMVRIFEADRETLGVNALAFVKESYDFQWVWKRYWSPFLDMLTDRFYGE